MSENPLPHSQFDAFARFYDHDYRDYDDDLSLILEVADECHGQAIELGCGTGRVLLPLADAGHSVTGVDISLALLAVARRKVAASGLGERVRLAQDDLRNLNQEPNTFAFAVCTSNTLMHLSSPTEQLDCLRSAHRVLKPGGCLLVDLFNPDIPRLLEVNGQMELADRWQDDETGAEVLKWSVRRLDIAEQLQETLFIYEEILPSGETKKTPCPFTLRYIWRNEGELMLASTGFSVDDVWGDFDGTPYDGFSEHLIYLARKE